MKRVVITGIGAVTPLGPDSASTWKAALAGRSGVGPITHFDASLFPSRIAGEVKPYDFSLWIKKDPGLSNAMANTRFALLACAEAIRDSGREFPGPNPRRVGLYFAAGDSGIPVESLTLDPKVANFEYEKERQPFAALGHLVRHFGIQGPAFNCLTACAASAQAIGEGAEIIRRGHADAVLSGGSHSMIHPFGLAGFCLLSTLSTANDEPERASRPFDATRDGFVLAEGAGAVVLEEYDYARRRGARIYGELVGYGSTADAHRLTDSHPDGLGAESAMKAALKGAGLRPDEVDYMNAHGTSTKVNDAVETLAVEKVFGGHAKKLPVSSTKSMTGHLIAAAGAIELQFCLLAMRDGVVPPTINYRNPDPQCDLDVVPNEARRVRVRAAMSNSFGFGGQNVVLAVKKI